MSRVHLQHRPTTPARAPRVLVTALVGLIVSGLPLWPVEAGTPARATSLHRAKPLKTLPALKVTKPAATSGMVSPYARAAAQRNDSGRVPPGRASVPPRPTANLTGQAAL